MFMPLDNIGLDFKERRIKSIDDSANDLAILVLGSCFFVKPKTEVPIVQNEV